jgi:pimeloyl-ACP methyl ester carboxylesterase
MQVIRPPAGAEFSEGHLEPFDGLSVALRCRSSTRTRRDTNTDRGVMLMAVRTKTITVDGAELHVEERGRGEPLLLLHGMTGTGSDWRHLFDLDVLGQNHRVIVPDARGHGRSTDTDQAFTFGQSARDVLAILDALGVGEVRSIGLSLGAKTLLHLATSVPSRVGAMVLVSATPRFPSATRALFRAAASNEHSAEEWTRMRTLHIHGDGQIERLWRLPARLAEDDIDLSFTPAELSKISARTLIVSGDRDPFYPLELAVEMYRSIPHSSLWVVPQGLHLPVFLAEREGFARTALSFIRG